MTEEPVYRMEGD